MTDTAVVDEASIELPERRSNRPVTVMHRIEYAAVVFLFVFFRLIGIDASSALSGRFMRLVGPMLRPASKRAEDNLAMIFPDWTEEQINRTTRDVWENLGRTAAEFAHLEKLRPFDPGGRVEVIGAERFRDNAEGRGPAIFVSGHFANWEVGSITVHRSGAQYAFVYRAANNPLVDELIIKKRGDVMSRYQIPKNKRSSRALIECLKSGRSLGLLSDQKLNDGIEAVFMGRKAMTAPAPARLSLKFNAPVIPITIERLKGARFRVTINEPIAFTPSGDMSADILALTNKINEAFEKDIRARPGQWLWLHRRWPKE